MGYLGEFDGARGPRLLRRLAALLIRGTGAEFIRTDLDDAMERDLARGLPWWQVRWRYAVNTIASAFNVLRARGMPRLPLSGLDVKLGLRNLVKRPGLTGVAVFALGVGIPVGMAPWQTTNAFEAPLPVDGGERIRVLRYWNVATSRPAATTAYDLVHWRQELTAFDTLGAARLGSYNVDSEGRVGEPVAGAEVTASTFDILRVPPSLGRALDANDETIEGPAVIVVGDEIWQARFGGDPGIVGRSVSVNGVPHTVVGVMPEGFLFPIRHQLWLPLRARPAGVPRDGLPLKIFGRLADGVTDAAAQAQLTAVGRRMTLELPGAHESLRPEVVLAAYLALGLPKGGFRALPEFYIAQVVALMLLGVACTNIGMLIFASTTARSSELAVRTALGASRARIVGQVFTESLVLALVAAGLGLLLISWLPGRLLAAANIAHLLPYWIDPGVTPGAVLRALSLAVFSAAVAGVVPALRATGASVRWNVRRARTGSSGRRFGGLSSVLIVADVAIAVIVVGLAVGIWDVVRDVRDGRVGAGIAADEFLSVEVRLAGNLSTTEAGESERQAFVARVGETQRELVRRLAAEPGVRGVPVGSSLPRMDHRNPRIEIEGDEPSAESDAAQARMARVDVDFFDGLAQPILSGRGFDLTDLDVAASTAIVNTNFVERVLDGRNPIGRRFRYTAWGSVEPSPWYEIVGVVGHLGMHMLRPELDEGFYLPAAPGEIYPVRMAIHVGADPEAFVPRLRELTREVDPVAVIRSPAALSKLFEGDWYIMSGTILGGGVFVSVLLAMAASGLYAIMSFAVAQRSREIGIRAALGARRGSIAFTVARRSLTQIGVGVLLGMPLAGRIFFEVSEQEPGGTGLAIAATVALGIGVMVLVSLAACAAPTVRALRIDPTAALRDGD